MKFICVLIAIVIVAATDAAAPKTQNLCDRIKCDTAEKVPVCGSNGNHYKAFENSCEMRLYNCNKGQRFAAVDNDICKIIYELGMGFFV